MRKIKISVFAPKKLDSSVFFVRKVARHTLQSLNLSGELEIIAASSKLMRKLNMAYRGKDRPTNVLAFSYSEKKSRVNFKRVRFQRSENFFGDSARCSAAKGKPFLQGQVFLEQSVFADLEDLTRLLVHAIVHIKGYSHDTMAEMKKMSKVEEKIIKLL